MLVTLATAVLNCSFSETPITAARSWTYDGRDGTSYVCSTDQHLLDLRAFNPALGLDILW